ncbi:MAG: hypothetical protein JNL12_11380, partial [Planctomycetes bacterium]|nr:hypothetical protein [Planctomycetota bacterium]
MSASDDDLPDDPVLDGLLAEALGDEPFADQVDAVRARLQADEVGGPAAAPPRRKNRWTIAAALLGLAVVVGTATWQHDRDTKVAHTRADEPVPMATVTSAAEARALPATTRGVAVVGGDDEVLAALLPLRDLEVLVVREPWNEAFGLSLKVAPPHQVQHVTAACWATFARFAKLRRLELRGTVHAGYHAASVPADAPPPAEAFAALERLPMLESLTLRCMDASDALLQQLPKLRMLRHLDLSFDHGFEEVGVAAILQCRELRSLSLAGCQQLHGRLLARLHELPQLELLDLSAIDGMNWRAGTAELDLPEARAALEHARRLAGQGGMGPTDAALEGLARCPKLRTLDIGNGHWTGAGLAELGALRSLRELDAFGGQDPSHGFVASLPKELERLDLCGEYGDALCSEIAAHLPKLRHLNLAACYRITERGLAALLANQALRSLDLRQMRGLGPGFAATLATGAHLERLDLRHSDALGADGLRALRQLPNLRVLDVSWCAQFGAEAARISSREAVDLLLALPALEDLQMLGWVPLADEDLA